MVSNVFFSQGFQFNVPTLTQPQPQPQPPPNPLTQPQLAQPRTGHPVQFRVQGFNPWQGFVEFDRLRDLLVDEMAGSFVGAMPPLEFLETFMNFQQGRARSINGKYDFSKINGDKRENPMYDVIVSAYSSIISRRFSLYHSILTS